MPSTVDTAQFATEQLQERWRRLSFQVKKTLRSPDAEAVHDVRVAARRCGQALVTFRAWLPAANVARLRRRLKTLLSTAGGVRDCDIAAEWLRRPGAKDPTPIRDEVDARRKGAERLLAAALRRWIRSRVKIAPAQLSKGPGGQSWDELARAEMPRRAKAFFRNGNRAAEGKASAGDLHKLRIAAKKLRYTFEIFESAYGPTAAARLEQLRGVQVALGEISDLRTIRKLVRHLGGGRKLDAAVHKKLRKKVAEFGGLWEEVFPSSERKEWMQFLEQPARKPVARSVSAEGGRGAAKPSLTAAAR